MAKQGRQTKNAARDGATTHDDASSPAPAWRGQAPARPRKRIKRKPMTVPASSKRPVGSGRDESRAAARPALALPSRETWSSVLRIAALLLTATAVTVGLIYLLGWPVLAVSRESTQIGGADRLTNEEIYEGSGIDGRNVLLLRAGDIAAAVKRVPGVEKAAVHVRLPNQVIIDIREHAPLVAWQGITETLWLATDGATVPQTGAQPPLTFADLSKGRLDKDPALRKLVLENLKAVYAVRPQLSEFYYADEPGLYYRAPEGWDVWLGESGPLEDKLSLADMTAQDLAKRGERAQVIDVRQSERKALWW